MGVKMASENDDVDYDAPELTELGTLVELTRGVPPGLPVSGGVGISVGGISIFGTF